MDGRQTLKLTKRPPPQPEPKPPAVLAPAKPAVQGHSPGEIMQKRWPHLFTDPVPLKIGIKQDIVANMPEGLSKKHLNNFMWHWTRTTRYLEAVQAATHRVDLAGNKTPLVQSGAGVRNDP